MYLILIFLSGSIVDNYTGMQNDPVLFPLFLLTACLSLLFLLFVFQKLGRGILASYDPWLLILLTAAAILVPWRGASGFLSGLHVFLAYAAFCDLNWILFRIGWQNVPDRNCYLAMLTVCILIVITENSVTGLAECIYAVSLSILLAWSIR